MTTELDRLESECLRLQGTGYAYESLGGPVADAVPLALIRLAKAATEYRALWLGLGAHTKTIEALASLDSALEEA